LTKATLAADTYLTARLDAPSGSLVSVYTSRARAISTVAAPLPQEEAIYYDYSDPGSPGGDQWSGLRSAVLSDIVSLPDWRFPWLEFESESDPTPACALYFSYYRVTGWQNVNWGGTPPGSRIMAYALNSWGATTVRSTTDHSGRFVPNALVNGGYAAAFGATAEPYLGNEPDVSTAVWCLAQGWTMGEAFFARIPTGTTCGRWWAIR